MRRLRLLVPANIRHNSGGNVYNARLVRGLQGLGVDVEVLAVDGSWPDATAKERRRLGSLLGAGEPRAGLDAGTVTIVDGLIACSAPDELEYAAAAGQQAWVLLHMPSIAEPAREARALRAVAGVICTSTSTAQAINAQHGLTSSHIALPGTEPAPVATGSNPPHITAVAALLPNKDQLLTVKALALLQDLDWTASLVGSEDADPEYAQQVRTAITDQGIQDKVRLTGELTGDALDNEWERADLSLLVSREEAFGLVVTESLARGVPVIVRQGTGAVAALTSASPSAGEADVLESTLPGAAVGLSGSPEPLAAVLRHWLEEPRLRSAWREAALAARERLPGWDVTARTVLGIVGGH
ncbi:glycosyltransferase family 4 protein [Arthrobacter sp. ISL-48]|uniref:glycosyltransferase family 4 protein n=1 Tax=Arthrobacter sp. ISL-48 TaxID=2819110 RepID=UPI001BE72B7D|nr:glycosyltransferase family 4 protein [Arthrobacter sp. ISL-48]MBT2533187.1 glycosyltransferase family 4 protein [Arthrobacter sp. ISL-48]